MRTIIEILLTNACNKACKYCVSKNKYGKNRNCLGKINQNGDYKLEPGILNFVILKKWLLLQKELDPQIVISGGEPTIVRTYVELLDWLYENNFKTPIIYSNGLNLKDLTHIENPKDKVKIILTNHVYMTKIDTMLFEQNINFIKELKIPTLIKILIDDKSIMNNKEILKNELKDKGFYVVIEGIRSSLPNDENEYTKAIEKYSNAFDGNSPYAWRWNGYGDKIDRTKTFCKETCIWSINPVGEIYNCHIFSRNDMKGSLYDLKKLSELNNIQLGLCCSSFADLITDNNEFNFNEWRKRETRCEIQHYVNIMENIS